mgnify:CR=1 FL=1
MIRIWRKRNIWLIPFCIFMLVAFACGSTTSEDTQEASQSEGSEELIEDDEPLIPTVTKTEQVEPTITFTVTDNPSATPTHTPSSTPKPTATENPFLISPGTYLVGTDIIPGIYYGEVGDSLWDSCYWERLKDLSGEFDAIIANGNGVGQFYVEVKESDFAFDIACDVVHIDGIPIPEDFLTELDPGMYIVGRDIQPGLYKGAAGDDIMDSCYWERLKDVSGGFSSIIANGNGVGQFYIQVSESDFALSVACPVTYQSE